MKTSLAFEATGRTMPRPLILFSILCTTAFGINYTANTVIVTEDVYLNYFSDQFTIDRIRDFIAFQKEWQWLTYLLLPITYFLKILLVTLCIITGMLFYDKVVVFWSVFQSALICEFIFIIPALIKVAWFGLLKVDFSLLEVYAFSPLSLISLFDVNTVDQWMIYPLQTISVFEFCYVALLSYKVKFLMEERFPTALRMTLVFYGSGLLLWLAVVAYLNLTFSS